MIGLILLGVFLGTLIGLIYSSKEFPKSEIKRLHKSYLNTVKNEGDWLHANNFVDHTYKEIVKPNSDTLYSYAFVDLNKSDAVLTFPPINGYYSFAFLGDNTDVLAYVTNRNNDKKNTFVLSNKSNMEVNLKTNICWIIFRISIEKNGGIDGTNQIQDELRLKYV